jgi:hypothetical protein
MFSLFIAPSLNEFLYNYVISLLPLMCAVNR